MNPLAKTATSTNQRSSKIVQPGEGRIFDNFKPLDWRGVLEAEGSQSDNLTLRFQTPVRIKENGKLIDKFSGFGQFISHLYWRLVLLAYFYCNPWEISDGRFLELGEEISRRREEFSRLADKDVKLEIPPQSNKWREFRRWSNRQNDEMLMGGFVGDLKLSGNLAPYLPLLYFGEHTHLGKQTTFGLGQYEIISLAESG